MITYDSISEGIFLSRPNRFLAHVEIDGETALVHVRNTGRCRELLLPGTKVWCQHHDDPARKTAWSLITVQKGSRLVNIDSQVPNKLALDYVGSGGLGFVPQRLKAEQRFGNSRFDLYYEAGSRKGFVEVKGVTLEEDGIARFPDAPTERGRKHLQELQQAAAAGYEAWVLFVLQLQGITQLEPNRLQDPAFSEALRSAAQAGVQLRAAECCVTETSIAITESVPVRL